METLLTENTFIKAWVEGVEVDQEALLQLMQLAKMPFIYKHIAVMPDVHVGIGATVGSVIPTKGAIIPAAVGVDIGCGMVAVKTSLTANQLPNNLHALRIAIEHAVPHGRSVRKGQRDIGAWREKDLPTSVKSAWSRLKNTYETILLKHPKASANYIITQLGTLGTGNHFIEICLDEKNAVWVMLHSGSRGVGNRIGSYFIELAKNDMRQHIANLPDKNLAYFSEGTQYFYDYLEAVNWAQEYARINREIMLEQVLIAMRKSLGLNFSLQETAINCHHNYVAREIHFGEKLWVTRKGAVRVKRNELGIIPGSMGACSYIVKGKNNQESFESCSHGAGRRMSRTQAKQVFTLADHKQATAGVECRKDKEVLDETPMAYKNIDKVMAAQKDLVEVVYQLKQIVCVKG